MVRRAGDYQVYALGRQCLERLCSVSDVDQAGAAYGVGFGVHILMVQPAAGSRFSDTVGPGPVAGVPALLPGQTEAVLAETYQAVASFQRGDDDADLGVVVPPVTFGYRGVGAVPVAG